MSEEKDSEWERKTWPVLKRICETTPEAGIHFQSMHAYTLFYNTTNCS